MLTTRHLIQKNATAAAEKGLLFVEFSNEERLTPCQWFVEAAFSSAPASEAGPSQYKHPLFSGKSFTTFIDSFRLTPKIANIFLKKTPSSDEKRKCIEEADAKAHMLSKSQYRENYKLG
jgi:hypothetical protein